MAERLATWVWVGTAALASVAGIVNVVGFLGFQQQAVTHLTGNTSLLAAALVGGDAGMALGLGAMLAAFVAGSMLSGLIVQDSTLRLGRRYGVVLTIESLMLLAAVPLFRQQHLAGPILAARPAACRTRWRPPIAAHWCAPRMSAGCSPTSASCSATRCAACRWRGDDWPCAHW